ncbi:MAG TPA: DUF5752 family protein [Myxococcota bacterium]|nr:DUF5752 family protein [Myxococcota bacterium]HRY92482.1 DUF5752 family protein [Myxococcota bacterium]HSA23319.1 DUF5752 family protein [Myxococcota bacterium]
MAIGIPAGPFVLKDCALLSVATGQRAQNLRELRECLVTVHPQAIYNHFWGGLLRPHFDDPEYNNDFASWANRGLHDKRLAERLGILDPANFDSIEELRRELLEVLDERLDESTFVPWARTDEQFHFVRSQMVVFDTGLQFATAGELAGALPTVSVGSIFYHVVAARWRPPVHQDDFRIWLERFGPEHEALVHALAELDPYFHSLSELRAQMVSLFDRWLVRRAPCTSC